MTARSAGRKTHNLVSNRDRCRNFKSNSPSRRRPYPPCVQSSNDSDILSDRRGASREHVTTGRRSSARKVGTGHSTDYVQALAEVQQLQRSDSLSCPSRVRRGDLPDGFCAAPFRRGGRKRADGEPIPLPSPERVPPPRNTAKRKPGRGVERSYDATRNSGQEGESFHTQPIARSHPAKNTGSYPQRFLNTILAVGSKTDRSLEHPHGGRGSVMGGRSPRRSVVCARGKDHRPGGKINSAVRAGDGTVPVGLRGERVCIGSSDETANLSLRDRISTEGEQSTSGDPNHVFACTSAPALYPILSSPRSYSAPCRLGFVDDRDSLFNAPRVGESAPRVHRSVSATSGPRRTEDIQFPKLRQGSTSRIPNRSTQPEDRERATTPREGDTRNSATRRPYSRRGSAAAASEAKTPACHEGSDKPFRIGGFPVTNAVKEETVVAIKTRNNGTVARSAVDVAEHNCVGTSLWAVLAGFVRYHYDFCMPEVERSQQHHHDVEKDSKAFKNWPLDNFPTTRVNVQALLKLAEVSELSPLADILQFFFNPEIFHRLFEGRTSGPYRGESFALYRHMNQLTQLRILVPLARRQARVWMSLFTVPKEKKRTQRVIVNAVPLNELQNMIPGPLDLPGLSDIEELVREHEFFCETDGVSWYNQFELPAWTLPYFAVRMRGKTFAWNTLPMGWKSSVTIAHAASLILHHLPNSSSRPMVYIDNGYRFGSSPESLNRDLEKVLSRAGSCGAVLTVTTPVCQEGTVLGVRVNLLHKTLSLPDSFISKLKQLNEALQRLNGSRRQPSHRLIWKVLGSIFWAVRVLGIPACSFPQVMQWIRSRARILGSRPELWEKPCHMGPFFVQHLANLLRRIEKNAPRSLKNIFGKTFPQRSHAQLWVDASDKGWGAVLLYETQLKICSGVFPASMKVSPIAYRELYAFEHGLRWAQSFGVGPVKVYSDNTNVVSWINRWSAGPPFVMQWLLRLYQEFYVKGVIQELSWIPSDLNPADKPSRALHT